MFWILIIIVVLVVIFLKFSRDKQAEDAKIESRGGLLKLYPNFDMYIKMEKLSLFGIPELTTERADKIEYRIRKKIDENQIGEYYISLNHVFKGWIEGYFITTSGQKINGYMIQIKNGIYEPDAYEYSMKFDRILDHIFKLPIFIQYLSSLSLIKSNKLNDDLLAGDFEW